MAFIFRTSMNHINSLELVLLSGVSSNLRLYWTAIFIVTSIIATIFRKFDLITHDRD